MEYRAESISSDRKIQGSSPVVPSIESASQVNLKEECNNSVSVVVNPWGFKSDTYDDTNGGVVLPTDIRKQILSAFPQDYKNCWCYYFDGIKWFICYFIVFCAAFYCQYHFSVACKNESNYLNQIKYVLLSPIWGWSFVGLVITGHDAVHGTFAPTSTYIGAILNKVTSFVCMDMLIFSSYTWNKQHLKHHKNVNVEGIDDMYIRGDNYITEQLWVGSIVLNYWFHDLCEVVSFRNFTRKFCIVIGTSFRFYYVFYVFTNADLCLLAVNILASLWFFNYICLLSHSIPLQSKGQTNDYFIQTMRETWDIYPSSKFMNFLHCGVAGHCSHHIFPYLPRSLFPMSHNQLRKYCPHEYRVIDNLKDEFWLFWNRRTKM